MGRQTGFKVGLCVAVLGGMGWAACGRSNVETAPATNPAIGPSDVVFTISQSTFSPTLGTVPPGARVTFLNRDQVSHEIVSDAVNGQSQCPELNGPPIAPAASFTFTMADKEESCGFHDALPGPTPNDAPGDNQARPVVAGTIIVTVGGTDGGLADGGGASSGSTGSSSGASSGTSAAPGQ